MTPDTEVSKPNCTLDSSGKKKILVLIAGPTPEFLNLDLREGILDSFNHIPWWSLPARSAESGLNSLANPAVIISSVSQMEQRLLTPKSPWSQYSPGPVRTRWGKPCIPGVWERPQRRHFVSEDPGRSWWRSAHTASFNRVNVFPYLTVLKLPFHLQPSCAHEGKNEIPKDHSGLLQRHPLTPNVFWNDLFCGLLQFNIYRGCSFSPFLHPQKRCCSS